MYYLCTKTMNSLSFVKLTISMHLSLRRKRFKGGEGQGSRLENYIFVDFVMFRIYVLNLFCNVTRYGTG